MFDELNLNFSHDDVLRSIKNQKLKTNKSGGPYYFINEILIHGKIVLVPILCNLFIKIFETGIFSTRVVGRIYHSVS